MHRFPAPSSKEGCRKLVLGVCPGGDVHNLQWTSPVPQHQDQTIVPPPAQITAGRGSNTEPGIAKPVALVHHSNRTGDISRQSSPGISPKDCFKYGKF